MDDRARLGPCQTCTSSYRCSGAWSMNITSKRRVNDQEEQAEIELLTTYPSRALGILRPSDSEIHVHLILSVPLRA